MIKLVTCTIDGNQINLTPWLLLLCTPLMLLKSLGVPLSWWLVFMPLWIVPAFMVGLAALCIGVLIIAFICAVILHFLE